MGFSAFAMAASTRVGNALGAGLAAKARLAALSSALVAPAIWCVQGAGQDSGRPARRVSEGCPRQLPVGLLETSLFCKQEGLASTSLCAMRPPVGRPSSTTSLLSLTVLLLAVPPPHPTHPPPHTCAGAWWPLS